MTWPQPLVGRAEEREALTQVLDSVRSGRSRALVVRGEPGIGKSALLEHAIADVNDLTVVKIRGVESEMALGHAALHQILSWFAEGVDDLPAPQARALRAVFGYADGVAPDRFLVGLASLTLLSNAAFRRGVVVVVDDAQWIDEESAFVLGFVARRLYMDGVGLIVAMRDTASGSVAFDELPGLTVGPLPNEHAMEILEQSAGGDLAPHVRQRVVDDAAGNALSLLEFTRELSPKQRAGLEPLPMPYGINRGLEARFLRRVRALPEETQTFLLVASADPTRDSDLIRNAARSLGCGERALAPAETVGLLRSGSPIEFHHPLVRSAVYQGASDHDRRRVHAALAANTDVRRDPDRHAWHRAAASIEPDEEVASELERAATRAQTAGSYGSSAALFGRAAQLSPDPGARAARYLGATAASLTAGNFGRASESIELVAPDLVDALLVGQGNRLKAALTFIAPVPGGDAEHPSANGRQEAAEYMLTAARQLEPYDVTIARDTLLDGLVMSCYAGKWSSVPPEVVARAIQAMPSAAGNQLSSVDALIDALAGLFADDSALAMPPLRSALAQIRADPRARESPRELSLGCWAGFALGDDEAVRALACESLHISRELGAWLVVSQALCYLCDVELRVGQLRAAQDLAAEIRDLGELLGAQNLGDALELLVWAWRGREREVRAAAPRIHRQAGDVGVGLVVELVEHALSVLELGLGNYGAALAGRSEHVSANVAFATIRVADDVEALVRIGRGGSTAERLDWLAQRATANDSAFDMGLLARCHALLAEAAAEAEVHYIESVERLDAADATLQAARSRLVYGEWLRRQHRRRDARLALSEALRVFESMGAQAFEHRTRAELLATGASARRRRDDTRDALTPQEEQIASLAATGATNPEIGARLFISANTVDYHLRKVYRKLGIKSRRDLVHGEYGGRTTRNGDSISPNATDHPTRVSGHPG